MGFERCEWVWRTERSSWFGHQSLLVRGRLALGVGAGMTGVSLSLALRVLSLSGMRRSPLLVGLRLYGIPNGRQPGEAEGPLCAGDPQTIQRLIPVTMIEPIDGAPFPAHPAPAGLPGGALRAAELPRRRR